MMGRKGQYFSFDAIVAAVIFIIAIALLSNYWFGITSVIEAQDDGMYREALRLSDTFLTPGTPQDWNTKLPGQWQDVHQVGFANSTEGNSLNDTKLRAFSTFLYPGGAFSELNYNNSKSMLRMQYEYYFNITCYDCAGGAGREQTFYEFGRNPILAKANNTVRVDRLAVLNDSLGTQRLVGMHVLLWSAKRRT